MLAPPVEYYWYSYLGSNLVSKHCFLSYREILFVESHFTPGAVLSNQQVPSTIENYTAI